MLKKKNTKLKCRHIVTFCIGLLAVIFTFLPSDVNAASDEALSVLQAVEQGQLDGKEIEIVTLDVSALQSDFSNTVQNALNDAKERSDGKLTRIVIPNGTYQPTGRALEIYSNTILDLRGDGANTLATTDDYNYVTIYQTEHPDDPPSLRCGSGNQDTEYVESEEISSGYDFYKNITILGGTFVGKRSTDGDKSSAGNACNVRFGHATNINIIGMKVTDNKGGHHLEIGACKDVLVADCHFSGYADGEETDNSKGNSLEAIQLDISHSDENNFAYYGENDDLPTCDTIVTGCIFDDVRRGVGTHHGVFNKPYQNITIKNNTFRNIDDKAIYFVYTKNAKIHDNTIESAVCGISFLYMVPVQQFMPNTGTVTPATDFISGSSIYNNEIYLDDTQALWDKTAEAKYGIRVGGESLETKTGDVPAKTYYLCSVQTYGNTIGVADGKGRLKEIRAGILSDYAASCDFMGNKVNLKGYNEPEDSNDEDISYGGILVSKSPNVSVASNVVDGITNGSKADGILITGCGGAKPITITDNIVNNAKRYGIHCYGVTNTALSVDANYIHDPGAAGVKLTSCKMNNVKNNTVDITKGTHMTEPGISITGSTVNEVIKNRISGTKSHGLMLSQSSSSSRINTNEITAPGYHGIALYGGSKAKITYNDIHDPIGNGVMISGSGSYSESIFGNEILNARGSGVQVYGGAKAAFVNENIITKPSGYGVFITQKSNITTVNRNVITKPGKRGIYVYSNSTVKDMDDNDIINPGDTGIALSGGAKATGNIQHNNISDVRAGYGIMVNGANTNAKRIYYNIITNVPQDGIKVGAGATATKVTCNRISGAKRYGIMVYDPKSYAEWVYDNIIRTGTKHGILVGNSAKVKYVDENEITSPKQNGIQISGKAMVTRVKKNIINKPLKNGVSLSGGSGDYAKTKITYNTIQTPKNYGIMVYDKNSRANSIYGNKVYNTGNHGIIVGNSAKVKYVNSNTISKPAKNGVIIYNTGYAETISNNKISNAGVHGVMVGDGAKVKTPSQAYLIQGNKLTKCKNRGICNNAKVNAIVANTCSGCGNNKVYIKKGLSLTKYQVSVKKGKTYKIPYLKASSSKGKVAWSTSNKKIAKVDKYGRVKGLKKGTAYIYAKTGGVTVKAKVTVK